MLSQGYHSNINDVALNVSTFANLKTKEMMFCLFICRYNRYINLRGQCCFALSVGHALSQDCLFSQPGHLEKRPGLEKAEPMSAQPRTLALASMMIASLPLLGFPYGYKSWTWSFPYGNRFQRWWWSESVTQAQSHAPYLITFV